MNTHYWRTRFINEFGIHFRENLRGTDTQVSKSELQFALAFIEEEIEKAVATYQTEYEQKHIASAVEIARKEEREKIVEWVRGSFQTGYVTMPQGGTHLIRTIDPDDLITHLTT